MAHGVRDELGPRTVAGATRRLGRREQRAQPKRIRVLEPMKIAARRLGTQPRDPRALGIELARSRREGLPYGPALGVVALALGGIAAALLIQLL